MLRIIKRTGLTPWPKLFHNLRVSRHTELATEYPIHVVCAWIGNSATIARRHYMQVTDDYFKRAAQIPAQSAAEMSCEERTGEPVESRKRRGVKDLHVTPIPVNTSNYAWRDSNPQPMAP